MGNANNRQTLSKIMDLKEALRERDDYRQLALDAERELQRMEQLVAVKRSNNRSLDTRNKRLEIERDKHHEDADTFLDKWSKAQERAIDAERALRKAWYIMDTIEGNDAVDEWQNKYSKYIESISCPECDALASHGANDGPCEAHK